LSVVDIDYVINHITNFDNFDFRLELYRKNDGAYSLLRAVATSQSDSRYPSTPRVEYNYGQFIFIKDTISSSKLISFIKDNLSFSDAIGAPVTSCDFLPVHRSFYHQHVFTKQSYSFHHREYPYDLYTLQADVENTPEYNPYLELNSGELPVFTLQEAETYYLFDHVLESVNPARYVFEILLEDTRGRIDEVSPGTNGLAIKVSGAEIDSCKVKVVGKNPGFVADTVSAREAMLNGISLPVKPADLRIYLTC